MVSLINILSVNWLLTHKQIAVNRKPKLANFKITQ